MRGKFFLKSLGVFEQDLKVTEFVEVDTRLRVGDEVVVQIRATVHNVLDGSAETPEIDLTNIRPEKIVRVYRRKHDG